MNRNKHLAFFIFFIIAVLLFLRRLITLQGVFIHGDNFMQFYPWFKTYSASIKAFQFPFWTRYIQSGFPLMAEGQIGGFYPLNILLFFILPFRIAYNYSIVLHFVIAGVFTYLYTRRIGADEAGGLLAALLFCFGSAYAGCFYNIITLRTLAWFPLVLFLFELYFKKRKLKFVLIAGVILGFQLLAGFIQVALYSAIFYLIYFIYKLRLLRFNLKRGLLALLIFLSLSFLISLPQIILTHQLAGFSSRQDATLGFALWGSFIPPGLLGSIFPYIMGSITGYLYVGIISLFFVIFCCYLVREQTDLRPIALMLVLSVFLALGRYNPLYVAALKLTGLYNFRNPSKFLFFGAFALSAMAGCGLTYFFKKNRAEEKKALSVFRWVLFISAFMVLVSKLIIHLFRDDILRFGNWYVRNFIYDTFQHRYSLDYYLQKVESIYNGMVAQLSFSDIFVVTSWILLIVALVVFPILLKRRLKKTLIFIIFIDIYIFSFFGVGFRGNISTFDRLKPDNPKVLERLQSDQELFRILPFDVMSQKLPNWSLPNANILYQIDSIGCYTPLASRIYKESLKGLEVVDDSLGLVPAEEEALKANLDILKLLNVKYIVSHKRLDQDFLSMVEEEGGAFLYMLRGYLPRVFFTHKIDGEINRVRTEQLDIIEYSSGLLKTEISTGGGGFLVFSENYYPGWQASIDGEPAEILPVKSLIQAVKIDKGTHRVIFTFKPKFL